MASSLALPPPPPYPSLQQPILLVWYPCPWFQAEQSRAHNLLSVSDTGYYPISEGLKQAITSTLPSSGPIPGSKAVCMAQKQCEADKKPGVKDDRWDIQQNTYYLGGKAMKRISLGNEGIQKHLRVLGNSETRHTPSTGCMLRKYPRRH